MGFATLKKILTSGWTPSLIGFPLALSAFAATEKIWVARPTGTMQCEESARSNLGEAVVDLESSDLVVSKAMVGTLNDRAQCTSCGICPDGSYNIAEIEASATAEQTARARGWELVDAQVVKVNH